MSDFSCGETKVCNDPQGIPTARERSVRDICEFFRASLVVRGELEGIVYASHV